MDRVLLQHSQIHNNCYPYLPAYDQYQYLNSVPENSGSVVSHIQPGNINDRVGSEQNQSFYGCDVSYLPPSQHTNECMWTTLENTNSVPSPQHYPSQNCVKIFPEHYITLYSNVKRFPCEICKKDFPAKHCLEQHQFIHIQDKSTFQQNDKIIWAASAQTEKSNHEKINTISVESQHCLTSKERKKFVCEICNKELNSKQSLTNHIRTHTGEKPFVCDVCGKDYADKKNLNKHLRDHTGEKPYACDQCEEAFSRKNHLNRHKVDIHTGEKPFSCDLCNSKFLAKTHLQQHLKRVHDGQRPYKCNICSKAFQTQYTLKRHQPVHTGERAYQCEICNKGFKFKGGYNIHLQTHKIVEKDGVKVHVPAKKAEKAFACDSCDKAFTTKAYLVYHKRCHTKETPFICKVCNARFVAKSALKKHTREHFGNLPYVCDICKKSFRFKSLLSSHKQKHKDNKQSICKLCKVQFVSKISLNKHLRFVHHTVPNYTSRTQSMMKYTEKHICEVCNKELSTKYGLVIHRRTHTGEKPYVCKECGLNFTNKSALNLHAKMKKHVKPSSKPLNLKVSKGSVNFTKSSIQNHNHENSNNEELLIKYRNRKKLFVCQICKKGLMSKHSFVKHVKSHAKEASFMHKRCNKEKLKNPPKNQVDEKITRESSEPSNYFYKGHKQVNLKQKSLNATLTIDKKRFPCSMCKKIFSSKRFLKNHLKTNHGDRRQFLPKISSAMFNFKTDSSKSYHSIHTKNKYKCFKCKKSFKFKSAYDYHLKLHQLKKYCFNANVYVGKATSYLTEQNLQINNKINPFICHVCKLSYCTKLLLQNHFQSCHSSFKGFSCDVCNLDFCNKFSLNQHIHHKHIDQKGFICLVCQKEFFSFKLLQKHHFSHIRKPFKCTVCKQAFISMSGLISHRYIHIVKEPCFKKSTLQKTHSGNEAFICNLCKKSFKLHSAFQNHLNTHYHSGENATETDSSEQKRFSCNVCVKTFSNFFSLIKHKKLHILRKQFICNVCNDLFVSKFNLDVHINKHNISGKYLCNVCKVSFSEKTLLDQHLQIHACEKLFTCKICRKKFPSNFSLKHHENLHFSRILYTCGMCHKYFNSYGAYEYHICRLLELQSSSMFKHESKVTISVPKQLKMPLKQFGNCRNSSELLGTELNSKLIKERKNYVCELCEKEFISKKILKTHLQVHIGDKQFVCAMCPLSFNDRNTCLTHMKIHSQSTKFVCEICNIEFSDREILSEHIQIHIKPYVCGMCPQSFSDKNDCLMHMKLHSREKSPLCDKFRDIFSKKHILNKHLLTH